MDIFTISAAIGAYIFGSIPTGYIISRRLAGIDIRQHGSGNPGSANVLRVVGKTAGTLTLSVDLLKGFVPVFLMLLWRGGNHDGAWICGAAAIAGHLWMIFLGFNGGKGVATTAGVFLAACPQAMLPTMLFFFAGTTLSGHISIGSIVGAAILPLACFVIGAPASWLGLALVASSLILYKHIANIRRLAAIYAI
jgi:glycerol-3-phosphate acyltransferase PlsY